MSNEISANRSTLKEFLASIATVQGDLSNITAPPFVLAVNSTVEIPQYWADHQSLFVSQGIDEDPEKRALSVLKYFLCTLRSQQYAGRHEEDGVKKPLNAFLGELFLGSWDHEKFGKTILVAEQVGHHPPVTACYLRNEKHGVWSQGFTEQEITFSGSVAIKQKGYAIVHLDEWEEDHLIPVPNIKVKGIIGGTPYPELTGDYSIISSSGYVSHISFSGKSWIGTGARNGFEATLYHAGKPKEILYSAKGNWNEKFTIRDERSGKDVETIDVHKLQSTTITVADQADQDPWESRKAWGDVIAALKGGDMQGVVDAKSVVEEGQREMRKDEEAQGKQWKSLFFQRVERDPLFEKLSTHDPSSFTVDPAGGIWKIDLDVVRDAKKPFHGDLLPTNGRNGAAAGKSAPQEDVNGAQGQQGQAEVPVVGGAVANGHTADTSTRDPALQKGGEQELPVRQAKQPELQRGEVDATEQQHAQGVVEGTSSQPTDIQVEEYLRTKNSNLR